VARETTFTCDRCGKPLEAEENKRPVHRKAGEHEHPMFTIEIDLTHVEDGMNYYGSEWAQFNNEKWELCWECGKIAQEGLRDALKS
jgi:hypothetical protein